MKPNESNDLDWLAFQYLADELDETQRDEFEERLADDQQAREALAGAVELTQTISAAGRVEHAVSPAKHSVNDSPKKVKHWRQVAWIATTIAGCLAIMLVYQFVRSLPDVFTRPLDNTGVVKQHETKHDELARRWIETVDEIAASDAQEFSMEQEEADSPELSFSSDEPLFTTPDWMVAAVSGLAGEMDLPDMEKLKETSEN